MTSEKIAEQKIVTYTPPYIKEKVTDYVNRHADITVSKFITDAVRDKLRQLGALPIGSRG